MSMLRRIRRSESGLTIVELSVAMFGLAFVSAIMLSWFVGANSVDQLHRDDDEVVQELRVSKELLTKDLRRARNVTVAEKQSITLWLDLDHNDFVGDGELVTWAIADSGELVRSTDTASGVTHATAVDVNASVFEYDAESPLLVRRVGFELVAQVDEGDTRSISTEVFMRNAA